MSADAAATASPATDRLGMIAKIHVAKKQLALEDDSYRGLLFRVTGLTSLRSMAPHQLDQVLREFKRLGWSPKPAISRDRQVRMIFGLWRELGPYLSDSSASALRAFVERQTGLADPNFLSAEQRNLVIEGLKAWLARKRRSAAKELGA